MLSGINFSLKVKSGSEDPIACARVRPSTLSSDSFWKSPMTVPILMLR